MVRPEKIIIFNGPKKAFDKYISKYYIKDGNNYNLTQLVNSSELERKTFLVKVPGYEQNPEIEISNNIDLLYISNNEFSNIYFKVTEKFVFYKLCGIINVSKRQNNFIYYLIKSDLETGS